MAADLLGAMRVEILGDNTKLDKSIKTSQKNTEEFGKKTASIGKTLSGLFAGIGFAVVAKKLFDLGKQAENLFQIQEKAEAKLDATLLATGFAAGLTAEELKKMATELQNVTTFGDETIISAQSMLLTFKDIGEDVFPRALSSILDVSEAMGTDLQSSTIQIGKALNDPIAGLSALSRVGIQFTEDQKELIKSFVETGDKASAQSVILKELESQFGGVAKAAALTSDGIKKQLDNSYGDLLETIGEVISKGMTPYRAELQKEIVSINASIKAHILRKKAVAGDATLIEELTLKQIEQEKAEQKLAQAKLNVKNAEENVIDTRYLSEAQISRIEAATQVALQQAADTITALEDEVTLRRLGTKAAQERLEAENKLLENNIDIITGTDELNEKINENTELNDLNTESLERQLEWAETENELRLQYFEDQATKAQESFEAQAEAAEEAAEREAEATEAAEERKRIAREETLALISSTISVIDSLFDNAAANEIARLEKEGATEEEINNLKKKFAKDNAIRERAIALFDIGINTASAIVKALPNIPLSIGVGILGGLQAAAVLSAPMPKFAQGGIVPGKDFTGDNVPVLANSGEMFLNKAQQAELFKVANGGSSGQTRIIVNLSGKPILDAVAKASKNGTMIIDSRSVI